MCVSQYREYCKTGSFRHLNREKDLNDPSLEVGEGTHWANGRSWYYVVDLNEMKKLAKNGNAYAIKHLKNK